MRAEALRASVTPPLHHFEFEFKVKVARLDEGFVAKRRCNSSSNHFGFECKVKVAAEEVPVALRRHVFAAGIRGGVTATARHFGLRMKVKLAERATQRSRLPMRGIYEEGGAVRERGGETQ